MRYKSHSQLRIQTVDFVQTILQNFDVLAQSFSLLSHVFLLQKKILELIFDVEVTH